MPGPKRRVAGPVVSRLAACLLCLATSVSVSAQDTSSAGFGPAGSLSDAIPLKRGPANPLDIAVPRSEPPARDDTANRVRDPDASSRFLDRLRNERLEDSTQRYRPALPSRRNDRSVEARANRPRDSLRVPDRSRLRPGRTGF